MDEEREGDREYPPQFTCVNAHPDIEEMHT